MSSDQHDTRAHIALAFSTLRAVVALQAERMGDPDLLARGSFSLFDDNRLETAAKWAADALQHAKRAHVAGACRRFIAPNAPSSPEAACPHIRVGDEVTFRYPTAFTSLPDYSAHRDQGVIVRRQLAAEAEYDFEGDAMFEIEASDGWRGHAFGSELEPRVARNLAEAFARRFLELQGADVLAAVVEDNRGYSAGACATHDYTDANMVMLDAWVKTFGRQPLMLEDVEGNPDLERQRDAEAGLWSHAWHIATAEELPRLMDSVLDQVWGFNDDDDFAQLEGWALRVDSDGYISIVATALPGGGVSPFSSDDAAGVHAVRCSAAGSMLHRRALSRLRAKSQDEYTRLVSLTAQDMTEASAS